MMMLLIINVTYHTPQSRVSDTITHVTLNSINGVVLGCVNFLALNVLVHPNLPPMIHPIIMGYLGEVDIFKQPCGNLWACPWGRSVPTGLYAPCARCSP